MKAKRLPVSSQFLVDQLVAYGQSAPQAVDSLPAHTLIRMLRKALRMTQAQLAARAKVPQSYLAVIESGRTDLKLSTLRKIVSALQGDLIIAARFRKTPEEMVAERIGELARKKVARVTGTMALEKQQPEDEMTRRLIQAEVDRMTREASSEIWEE